MDALQKWADGGPRPLANGCLHNFMRRKSLLFTSTIANTSTKVLETLSQSACSAPAAKMEDHVKEIRATLWYTTTDSLVWCPGALVVAKESSQQFTLTSRVLGLGSQKQPRWMKADDFVCRKLIILKKFYKAIVNFTASK